MLSRFKTFVATGLATAGRLYAGDLNGIQDAVAAQSDYAQRIDALTYGVGEAALALTRYGAGEARLTGSLRVDGVVRALGALFVGNYTTTQRDAIPAGVGNTPFSAIIFNSTTGRLEMNKGNDTTRNWQPFLGANVEKNSAGPVYSEAGINFIEGPGTTLTIADNPGAGFVDVTISAPAAAVAGIVPIGGSIIWNGASDPPNYLIEDGRSLLRAGTYAALFTAIGVTYGSVDGTHFNIPDSRGRMQVGVGTKVTLAETEGLPVASRAPEHHHTYTVPINPHGGFTTDGNAPDGVLISQNTSGDFQNTDTSAYIGKNFAIRYQ